MSVKGGEDLDFLKFVECQGRLVKCQVKCRVSRTLRIKEAEYQGRLVSRT